MRNIQQPLIQCHHCREDYEQVSFNTWVHGVQWDKYMPHFGSVANHHRDMFQLYAICERDSRRLGLLRSENITVPEYYKACAKAGEPPAIPGLSLPL